MTEPQPSLDASSSSLRAEITQSLVASIRCALGGDHPFSHLYATQMLPTAVFEWLVKHPPEPKSLSDLHHRDALRSDGTSRRKQFGLDAANLERLPEGEAGVWRAIHEALTSREVRAALFERLQGDLSRRFELPSERLDEVESHPLTLYVEDAVGYWIMPHKDVTRKHVTVQIYLPEDESQRGLGTTLYRERWPRSIGALVKRASRVLPRPWRHRLFLSEAKTFPFMPNSGYAFAVGDKSWHGRSEVGHEYADRRSLMLIFYAPDAKELEPGSDGY